MVPHGRTGALKLERADFMQAAAERVQRELVAAAAEERRRGDRAAKARKKRVDMTSDENVMAAPENVTRETTTATSGQEDLVAAIMDSVALAFKTVAGAMLADWRSV